MGENDEKESLAPNFFKRFRSALGFRRVQEQRLAIGKMVKYGVVRGDYTLQDEIDSPEKLHGIENVLVEQITALSKLITNRPVIFVDFGGGLGLSAVRIAKSLESLINEGKVAVVVTNLEFIPTNEDLERYFKNRRVSQLELDFLRTNRDLAHYLKTDALHLDKHKVHTHKGNFTLIGNIDLLHEKTALKHGKINDYDLLKLGKSLSDYGTFLLGSLYLDRAGTLGLSETPQEFNERQKAYEVGLRNLTKIGLNKEWFESAYLVFRKGKAPPLKHYSLYS